jgi:prepilin-type N-terminal cleavage/methylation domain-containing protein
MDGGAMSFRGAVTPQQRGFSLPELMIASLIGAGVMVMALECLVMVDTLATRHLTREAAREQAEWVLGYLSGQARDFSLSGLTSDGGKLIPGDRSILLEFDGGTRIDCLGRLERTTTLRKRFYLVRDDGGLFDLRCSQQGGGDGAWTLASALHGLSVVLSVDTNADGTVDRHTVPPDLLAGEIPMIATFAVPVCKRSFPKTNTDPDPTVTPAPDWWPAEGSLLLGVPGDFEWMVTSVRLR